MFGLSDAQYAAVHLRGGHIPFNDGKAKELVEMSETRGSLLQMLLGSLHCLKLWKLPYFVAANDQDIRHAFGEGFFVGAHMRNSTQVFLSGHHQGDADWLGTFVELGIMAKARCFISSSSSFSDVARWYSGNTDCVRYLIQPPEQTPIPTSLECFQDFRKSNQTVL